MENFTAISSSSPLNNFSRVAKEEMTLLGAPVIKGTAQDRAITHKIEEGHRPAVTSSLT